MEHTIYPSALKAKIAFLLTRWEEVITVLTILSAVSAIGLGFLWMVMKEMALLYLSMGFSGLYLIGKKYWKFRQMSPLTRSDLRDQRPLEKS